MIDLGIVDALFEQSQATGQRIRCGLCDKRVVVPLSQLPEAVMKETAEDVSAQDLELQAAAGWFPVVEGAACEDGKGVPVYVPARIGLFRALEREGWSDDELRLVANFMEWKIDNVLTREDLAYLDDDLEALVSFTRARIEALENGSATDAEGNALDRAREIAEEREQLQVFEMMQASGIPPHLQPRVTKDAFRVRVMNDMMRAWLLEADEMKVRAGYSPVIVFSSYSTGPQGFAAGEIDWEGTVRSAMADADPSGVPHLRVPDFRLRGDRVVSSRTLRPTDYGNSWRKHNLDCYLDAWAKLHQERRCQNCRAPLSADADERRIFCCEKCRNAFKQRRHRANNREAVERAQSRYWRSLKIGDDAESN